LFGEEPSQRAATNAFGLSLGLSCVLSTVCGRAHRHNARHSELEDFMKRSLLVGLSMIAVLAAAQPAQAGRARRAVRTTAIVAAATGTAAVVAAAPRRTTVVAAAPVAVAVIKPAPVVLAPDLTITDIAAEGDVLCITVKNIGQIASPQTRMRIDLTQVAGGALVTRQFVRVLPLQVNQSVKIRLRSAPIAGVRALAFVDPKNELAELNERNNDLAVMFAAQAVEPVISEPAMLEDVGAWGGIEFQASAGASLGAAN
jgi:hypothetical protein